MRMRISLSQRRSPARPGTGMSRKNLLYWQAFPAGASRSLGAPPAAGAEEECPAIETIIQYKPGPAAACCGCS